MIWRKMNSTVQSPQGTAGLVYSGKEKARVNGVNCGLRWEADKQPVPVSRLSVRVRSSVVITILRQLKNIEQSAEVKFKFKWQYLF